MNQDEEQLRLLSIFHYVVAGLTALCSLFPIIHLAVGLFFVLAPGKVFPTVNGQPPPPVFIGWIFVIVAGGIILCGLTLATLILAAARNLSKRRGYTFCMVMACVDCVFMPFGTVLGIFTIMVLNRASVKQLFGAR